MTFSHVTPVQIRYGVLESEAVTLIITKHAQKRLKERCGLNKKASERLAKLAYEHGIKHNETTGNLRKWVDSQYFYNETANNIRLYGDKAFIFSDYKLITVLQIPHNLVRYVKRRA